MLYVAFMDCLTKWPEMFAVPDKANVSTAILLVKLVIMVYPLRFYWTEENHSYQLAYASPDG